MNTLYKYLILAFLWAFLSLGSSRVLRASETRVGVAAVNITPPIGIPMAGYYHERGADGVLDPLFGKAMVIEQNGERAAFVVLDIISVTRAVTDAARTRIEKETGIHGSRVMISATHAHTGPELANRRKTSSDMGGDNQLAVQYTENLPGLIAESVKVANDRLQSALVSYAKGRCEGLAYNRRYFMRDGSVGWNPGKLNPDIVMPAGPNDPEVGLLHFEKSRAQGPLETIATFVNFAMHPDTTGGSKISADWPGALSRVLAGYHGAQHITLVANGTCGNINNYDFSWKWPNGGAFEQNRIGTILGATVFQAYKELKPVEIGPLRSKSEIVELPLPEFTPQQIEEANRVIQTIKTDAGSNFMKLVRAYRILDVASRKGKPHRAEVQTIALGPEIAWVALPGEVFVELGLAIKKFSPFPQTFVVELANDNIGYIPDKRSYAEGNYEPESARCAAGSGEMLVKTAVKLLKELHELNAVDTVDRLGETIAIPAGPFSMGNTGREGYEGPEEFPQHTINLAAYRIGKYEVTRGEFGKFIEEGGYTNASYWSSEGWKWKESNVIDYAGMNGSVTHTVRPNSDRKRAAPEHWAEEQEWIGHGFGHPRFTQTDRHPVVGVTYYEAEAYCKWAGGRLPTEAEWEKAARWDEKKQHANTWPWGDSWDPEACNNPADHNPAGGGYSVNQSAPVGSYPKGASPYGCMDMVGNAYEWVADCAKSYPGNPKSFDHSPFRFVRGGCWDDGPFSVRCAYRGWYLPPSSSGVGPGDSDYIGFRVAR